MFDDTMKIFVACAELSVRKDIHSAWLQFSEGSKGSDTFKTPSPLRATFAFTHPCFEMFLNDPTAPIQASFTATPSPSTTPSPPPPLHKNFDHTQSPTIDFFSVIDVWGVGFRVHYIKLSSYQLFCLFLCIKMHLSIWDKVTYWMHIILHQKL